MIVADIETAVDLLYYEAVAKTVLIETIVEELMKSRSGSQKVIDQGKKLYRRINWMKMARKAGAYGMTVATGVPQGPPLRERVDVGPEP